MKIDRAIEIFETEEEDTFMGSETEWKSALKLGIEALKRLQEERKHMQTAFTGLLPGEIKR